MLGNQVWATFTFLLQLCADRYQGIDYLLSVARGIARSLTFVLILVS